MKLLRTLGILFLLLLLILGVLTFIAPTKLQVERSTVINAPARAIFPAIKSLKEQQSWSEWNRAYDDISSKIVGEDGTVGAESIWKSAQAGNGSQKIRNIIPNKRVDTRLEFEGRGGADAAITLAPEGDGTKITWTFDGDETSRPYNIPLLFSDFGIGSSYDKSLGHLKEMVESKQLAYEKKREEQEERQESFQVKEVEFPTRTVAAFRKKMRMADAYGFVQAELPLLQLQFDKREIESAGSPMRLVYNWDEEKGNADLAVAIPTNGVADFGGDYTSIQLPSKRALLMEYRGDHATIKTAHNLMRLQMQNKGLKHVPPIVEDYITDPEQEPNPANWLTRVYFFVE